MISKAAFNESSIKCICRTPELIEGYSDAISDDSQTYICHHRLETHTSDGERRQVELTMDELIALDMYYNRPPEELIFMTRAEHRALHENGKFKKGHKVNKQLVSERTKEAMKDIDMKVVINNWKKENPQKYEDMLKKMSEAHKGKSSLHSKEWNKKISESKKGRPSGNKGMHWKLVDGKRVYYSKEIVYEVYIRR